MASYSMSKPRAMRILVFAAASISPWAAVCAEPGLDKEVAQLIQNKCLPCHSEKGQAGLDLRTEASILRGGKSGPAIQAGNSEHSLLIEKVVSKSMPPVGDKLTEAQIVMLRNWVDHLQSATQVTESEVLPIFQMRCVVCHGKRKQEGGLDLRTQASRLKGGKSGPAIVAGKPEASPVYQKIASGQMPPPKMLVEYVVRPPTTQEVETIRKWIAAGAPPARTQPVETAADRMVTDKDRQFWSFQPPVRPAVPTPQHASEVRNPIDAFLLRKLEAKGLDFNAPARKLTLLRRVYLDLTGLPPTPAELDSYLKDRRVDAYERLVDRLLASPRYGERWAKFWLEAAGYSDSEGIVDEDLIRPNAWRYRDYVIRAFNEDKAFDQFLTEQIAGDELADYRHAKQLSPEMREKLIATGFLRLTPDGTYSPSNGAIPERMDVISDELQVLSSSVLGLTVGCARCHNHKYDPIPQRDYYRLSAILQSAYDPYDWVKPTERYLDFAPEEERKEVAAFNAPIEAQLEKLKTELDTKAKPYRAKFLAESADKTLEFKDVKEEDLVAKYAEFRVDTSELRENITRTKKKLRDKPQIRALYEMGGEPSQSYLLRRGEAQQLGEAVQPGVPTVISVGLQPYDPKPPFPDASGRRLALARWLTQPNHPLTARVFVNRLWMHHFGKGIVVSAANFGRLGTPPSDPELLDWLATEFVTRGWSVKTMQRLMVTSTAYRQSSAITPASEKTDPENTLLSRMPLRRMDAEQLHDSILSVTEELSSKSFGPPVPVETKAAGEVVAAGSNKEGFRRSIYVLQRRSTPLTLLEVFDSPPMSPNCIERAYSTVAPQALELTNSDGLRDRARYLAGRLIDGSPSDAAKQVSQAYLQTLGRPATPVEIKQALADIDRLASLWQDHLRKQKDDAPRAAEARWFALADLCHSLLSSAEFSYID